MGVENWNATLYIQRDFNYINTSWRQTCVLCMSVWMTGGNTPNVSNGCLWVVGLRLPVSSNWPHFPNLHFHTHTHTLLSTPARPLLMLFPMPGMPFPHFYLFKFFTSPKSSSKKPFEKLELIRQELCSDRFCLNPGPSPYWLCKLGQVKSSFSSQFSHQ